MRMTRREALGAGAVLLVSPALAQEKKEPPMIPGPDPNVKTTARKAPAGAVDTHCHIFGPQAKYPFVPTRPYTPPAARLHPCLVVHDNIGCGPS